eukprot:7155_1
MMGQPMMGQPKMGGMTPIMPGMAAMPKMNGGYGMGMGGGMNPMMGGMGMGMGGMPGQMMGQPMMGGMNPLMPGMAGMPNDGSTNDGWYESINARYGRYAKYEWNGWYANHGIWWYAWYE